MTLYFCGQSLTNIRKRIRSIKVPNGIERLSFLIPNYDRTHLIDEMMATGTIILTTNAIHWVSAIGKRVLVELVESIFINIYLEDRRIGGHKTIEVSFQSITELREIVNHSCSFLLVEKKKEIQELDIIIFSLIFNQCYLLESVAADAGADPERRFNAD